jgi:hypothetical protein
MAIRAATTPLTDADWSEIRAILALAHLRSRYQAWRQEEQDRGIGLDAAAFTAAAGPGVAEGPWPPEPADVPGGQPPWVDPELLALDDIPRSIAGAEARLLWQRRAEQLQENAAAIRAARPDGWEQQLRAALGAVAAGDPPWSQWISAHAADLDDLDPDVAADAAAGHPRPPRRHEPAGVSPRRGRQRGVRQPHNPRRVGPRRRRTPAGNGPQGAVSVSGVADG